MGKFEITPEMQDAYTNWRINIRFHDVEVMCNALRDAVAAWMKAKFERDHTAVYLINGGDVCAECYNHFEPAHPGHIYTWEQWQAEAHRRLMGQD